MLLAQKSFCLLSGFTENSNMSVGDPVLRRVKRSLAKKRHLGKKKNFGKKMDAQKSSHKKLVGSNFLRSAIVIKVPTASGIPGKDKRRIFSPGKMMEFCNCTNNP